ncbi:MAG: four helix bundle protein [Desulfobacteraceae bacterium]|nr:MAG: four helix bundle protein [Desulfobacteraceae bacterium]
MKIERFEDLECWQAARALTKSIYGYARRAGFSMDYRLSGQITGAASSIMNNICEGFDVRSDREFIRFLFYSRRSCSEVQNCLYIASDQKYISNDEFQQTYDHCTKIRKIIDGLIRYLKVPNSSIQDRTPSPGKPGISPAADKYHPKSGRPATD